MPLIKFLVEKGKLIMWGIISFCIGYRLYVNLRYETATYKFHSKKYQMLKFYFDTKKEYQEEKKSKELEKRDKRIQNRLIKAKRSNDHGTIC